MLLPITKEENLYSSRKWANKSELNFLSKAQLTKKKDRILIKDLISNKWKYKTKEARLILQSEIYIYFLPIFRKARPSFFRVLHTVMGLS